MFKKIKKPFAITSTMALVLSMSTPAFAMGPSAGGMGNSQTTQSANVQSGRMQPSQGTNGRMQSQQSQNATAQSVSQIQGTERSAQGGINQGMNGMQQEMGMAGGNRGGMITEVITALSDEDAETLSDYISAYEDALAEEMAAIEDADEDTDLSSYREAVQTALQALRDAAEDEDIDLGSMSERSQGQMMNGLGNGRFTEAIAALSDEDAETLSDYISAYEDALAEEMAAIEDADEDTDLSSYREAVHSAIQALRDAAEDADIDL
jgi:phage FluMu protein gp41